MYKVLSAENCSDTQLATVSAAANQNPPSKSLRSFFSESFISSGKQGGGAIVLGEGHVIVTRETCIPISLNINNVGKAAVLHPALFCGWGHAKLSLLIIGHSCVYVKFS
jgi:hypothetical protein